MKSLNFKTNIKRFKINEDENAVISVNTADIGIFERAEKSKEFLTNIQKEYQKAEENNMIELMSSLDKQVRQQINYIFGSDVCTVAFGTANCISFCDGIPMFVGFLNALLGEVEKDMSNENKITKKKIEEYTSQAKKFK